MGSVQGARCRTSANGDAAEFIISVCGGVIDGGGFMTCMSQAHVSSACMSQPQPLLDGGRMNPHAPTSDRYTDIGMMYSQTDTWID